MISSLYLVPRPGIEYILAFERSPKYSAFGEKITFTLIKIRKMKVIECLPYCL